MMNINFLNGVNNGNSGDFEVPDGIKVGDFLTLQDLDYDRDSMKIKVAGVDADVDTILKPGDRLILTPTKIAAGC